MKLASLLCAAALFALPAGTALAKPDKQKAKAHVHLTHKRIHAVRAIKPAAPKDPWAAYWNDPGRAFPPFSYRGN